MAYDAMGNYTGYDDTETYETEEQRRRRLAAEQANAVVHTTQVKTYGDGTQEETTKRTIAAPGPVSPDQVFQRQIQAESGGQHYAPGGGILTSPAGAQGIAQVMPATAANPGYGIKPATPEEIATPEGNQAFGERYKQGMLSLFGGDQQKATAAYNAGPGRVQQAEAQAAQQGGSWTDYIPKETMGYLGKVFGGMIPSAQAGTLPPQPVAPQAPQSAERPLPPGMVRDADGTLRLTSMPGQAPAEAPAEAQSPYALTAPSGQGLQVPGVPAAAPAADPYIKKYQESQDDIRSLLPLAQDATAPEWLRNRASERAAELNRNQVEEQRAKSQISNMNPNQVASELRKKGEEGSWVKAILFGILGMENSQKEEAAKLGIGRWETAQITGPEGESINVEIKRAPNGKILEGTRSDGTPLTSTEMAEMSVGGKTTKPTVSTQDVEKGDLRGRVVTENLPNGRTKTYVESGGKRYTYDASWKPVSISTAAAKAEAGQQITLKYAEAIQAAKGSGETKGKLTEYGINVLTTPDGQTVLEQNGQILRPDAAGNISVSSPAGKATSLAQLRSGEKLNLERGQGVIKAMDEEIRPQAQAGDTVSSVRKQQFAIFDRPGVDASKLFGLATGAGQSPGDQKWTMVRDIFSGAVASNSDGSPMNGTQLSQRLQGLNLTPAEVSALAEYNIANQKINAATLKQTAGPGSVSNAEQQANRESNVDIRQIPALGAYNAMAQSQFDGDRARYKADWAAGKDFKTALEMDKAWRKENQQLAETYADIAKDRIKFINANGNTANAVKQAYKIFPVPEYDPGSESWKKTKRMSSYER